MKVNGIGKEKKNHKKYKLLRKNKKVCEQNNETVRKEWNLPKPKESLKFEIILKLF